MARSVSTVSERTRNRPHEHDYFSVYRKTNKQTNKAAFQAGSTKQVIYKTWSSTHLSSSNQAVVSAFFHSNTELDIPELSLWGTYWKGAAFLTVRMLTYSKESCAVCTGSYFHTSGKFQNIPHSSHGSAASNHKGSNSHFIAAVSISNILTLIPGTFSFLCIQHKK